MQDVYDTPFDRYDTPFDGDEEARRLDAALDRLEARLDWMDGRLDRTIRTMRRLFIRLALGLTVELGLSVWILLRLR